jgi:hypothetical protein
MSTLRALPLLACLAGPLFTGCSSLAPPPQAPLQASAPSPRAVVQSLRESRPDDAADQAQQWLAQAPGDGLGHLLLAAAHHRRGDAPSLLLAASGYDAATRLQADTFWSRYLAGALSLQQQDTASAVRHFAAAVLADPERALALEGLAAAAYAQGELPLALQAAQAALARDAGSRSAWRTTWLATAAAGDGVGVQDLQVRAAAADAPLALRQLLADDALARRGRTLLATAAVDQPRDAAPGLVAQAAVPATGLPGATADAAGTSATPSQRPALPQQVTVDAVLILSDLRDNSSYGVDLLNGLSLGFGATRVANGVVGQSTQTAISRALRIPDITYTLNIANRGNRRYAVAARPSLTAFAGQTSSFFVGEQVFVRVAGVNTAQLERIDVGVTLKVTPTEVREDGARFRIEADRSFFSDQGVGGFSEQLATFKQSVNAVADVRFGETLVLSGLVEQVRDTGNSRTPGLGDVPGPDLLFSRRTAVERQRSVLVLVTPSLPATAPRPPRAVAEETRRLLELWDQIVEPRLGRGELLRRALGTSRFTRGSAGDVSARGLDDPEVLRDFLGHAQAEVDRSAMR